MFEKSIVRPSQVVNHHPPASEVMHHHTLMVFMSICKLVFKQIARKINRNK